MISKRLPATLLVLLLAFPAHAQSAPTDSLFDPFTVLVHVGDAARKQGRMDDAFIAYGSALKIKEDPTVRGRLGMLAAASDAPVVAANSLLHAIEGNGGADEKEKKAFAMAFLEVRAKVCQLLIRGNVYDAEVWIDGAISGENIGPSYKVFLSPGKHTAVGKSPTAGEVSRDFDCPKGATADVSLEWTSPELPAPGTIIEPVEKRRFEGPRPPDVVKAPPLSVAPAPKKALPHWALGVGTTAVIGVATWTPAVGAVISGSWRPMEEVSLGLDVRAAWVPVGIGGHRIYAMTAGGVVNACAHWRWLFGCATGHVGFYKVDFATETYLPTSAIEFRPGLGGRVGARLRVWNALSLQFTIDALGLEATRVALGPKLVSEVRGFMSSASLTGLWEF